MRIKALTLILFSLYGFLLTGCASQPNLAIQSDDQDLRAATSKIANSAQSVSQSLQELAAIERATHPAAKVPNPMDPVAIGMDQILSIDWTGPVGLLVNKIAQISQYKVRVLGKNPAIPIIVSVMAKNIPLANILRDVNFQCGRRANIAVYAANRIIELRYAKN